jgi:hypothetical protein
MDTLPNINASYEVSVRQTSALPQTSFRHSLTSLPLPLANASPYRAYRGLSPPNISALPGTPQKKTVSNETALVNLLKKLLIDNDDCYLVFFC